MSTLYQAIPAFWDCKLLDHNSLAMPPSEQYKLTQKVRSKFNAYIEARGKMKKAQAKLDAVREKTAVARAEAVSARKTLLERFPDAEPPVIPEDRELASDA